MMPDIQDVLFEESSDRLKIVLPLKRSWVWLLIYSILLLLWVAGFVWGLIFTIRDIAFSGQRYAIVFTIMLLVWLYIWYRLGKVVWRQWQLYFATREILFLDKTRLIVRRPVSILGITDAYDMAYVSPFFYSEERAAPGFDYGNQRVYLGANLSEQAARQLIGYLNDRFFNVFDDGDF